MPNLAGGRLALAGFGAFAVVAAIVRIAYFQSPMAGDVTQFLYVGETVGNGGMPYADAAFNKGPLTALLFAVIDPIVGTSPTAVHLTVIPFVALGALALAAYVTHHVDRWAGALAGLAFAAFSGINDVEGGSAKTEQFGVAPVFGALWCATRQGIAGPAGAGALLACAILINPSLGVAIPAVLVELWLGTPPGQRARRYGAMAAAAAAAVLPVFAWLAVGGALDDMFVQVGGKVVSTVGAVPRYGMALAVVRPGRFHLPAAGLWAVAFVGCAVAFRDPRLRRPALALALVIGVVALRMKIAAYEFGYEYYPALPAICGAIALGVAAVWPSRPLERAAVAALVFTFPLWTLAVNPQLELLARDPNARDAYAASVYPVASFIRAHTIPTDPIMVAGGRAEVYWVAERRAPTRFFDVFAIRDHGAYAAERRRDLSRHPPAALVFMKTELLSYDRDLQRLALSGAYTKAFSRDGSSVWLRRGLDRTPAGVPPGP
ncbi:MAG: hypothetical protein QOE06_3347 [Thermoleophilaceae bacterium]|jgi:hypothetical protein|nr:hypothetical protein [Thermoleophilaceae bacterium]